MEILRRRRVYRVAALGGAAVILAGCGGSEGIDCEVTSVQVVNTAEQQGATALEEPVDQTADVHQSGLGGTVYGGNEIFNFDGWTRVKSSSPSSLDDPQYDGIWLRQASESRDEIVHDGTWMPAEDVREYATSPSRPEHPANLVNLNAQCEIS